MRLSTLKKRSEFQRLARSPHKWVAPHFIMQALPNSRESPPDQAVLDHRFGFVVTKKMGGAVVRNRIRRRFKGALGVLLTNGVLRVSDIPEKIAFVLIARTSASTCSFEDLLTHLGKAIRRLSSLCTLSSASTSKNP